MLSDTDTDDHYNPTIRLLEIERNSSKNCGFHLTRGKWDPYPWVSDVDRGTAAHCAGMKPGDCLLEVNGEDVIGQRISEIAEIVKSKPEQVSLLLWNAGVDPQCTPEAVCCGPMPTNLQRLSACMSTILAFLECPVCLDTIQPPTYQCDNGHLICIRCRTKSERCPVCRLRLNRGRSLLSDQVYYALIDAFNLREEPDTVKVSKMQQIFKMKNKTHQNKNVPDIKITQSTQHTNKFLARLLTGKSSSVENLTTNSKFLTPSSNFSNEFNNSNLKTKSLSTNEIFQQYDNSPSVSRSGSISKLSRNEKNKYLKITSDNNNRSASCHGSFECLSDNTSHCNNFTTTFSHLTEENILFYCPFAANCTTLIKGTAITDHFQTVHDGPLIHFFTETIQLTLHKILKHKHLCYVINTKGNIFYLKAEFDNQNSSSNSEDICLWMWLLGDKKLSKEYAIQVKIVNKITNNIIISVQNCVSSLNCSSYQDIKDNKKGIFFNANTLSGLDLSTKNIVVDIEIVKSDCE